MTTEQIREYLETPGNAGLRFFPYQVAKELSDLAAILLYDLQGRIKRQRKKLIRDRLQWTYDPQRIFAEDHPYASESGIRKAFIALEGAALIKIEKTGKYNSFGPDEKHWYHVTPAGHKCALRRRIRFNPLIAVALDIPKAVLLENVRHKFHTEDGGAAVTLNPKELGIPYHYRTIERHLDKLVENHILERNPNDEDEYRIATAAGTPLAVDPNLLLPQLQIGEVGLLVGHSGTGKTSYSTFVAIQSALAGSKVLCLSLEEPVQNLIDRMYAQEFGVSYSDLHRGVQSAIDRVNAGMAEKTERIVSLGGRIRFVDFRGSNRQTHELHDAIAVQLAAGYVPDVVIIDQLEFISVESEAVEKFDHPNQAVDQLDTYDLGISIPPALLIRECLGDRQFATWVLHQVNGHCALDFPTSDISGGADVAKCFDAVVGIGREEKDSNELRVFSMTRAVKFEQQLHADFPHMRFMPKRKRV